MADPVANGDYDALVRVMHVLYDIRERTNEIDDMFEPLWHTIDLLKTCDVEMPESAHIALQVCSLAFFARRFMNENYNSKLTKMKIKKTFLNENSSINDKNNILSRPLNLEIFFLHI